MRAGIPGFYTVLARVLLVAMIGANPGFSFAQSAEGSSHAPSREINTQPSRLALLAEHLSEFEEEDIRELGRIALFELIYDYRLELDRADGAVSRNRKSRNKLNQWRYATNAYFLQLQETYHALDRGAPIAMQLDNQQRLLFVVEGYPVVISGPRIGFEKELEHRIVEQYCGTYICDGLWSSLSDRGSAADHSDSGVWVLSQRHGPKFETGDGLSIGFQNLSDRAQKERVCMGVVMELRVLAAALKRARETGETLEWPTLNIRAMPVDRMHRIVINTRGDYLKLYLPGLAESPELLENARPWLRSHSNGGQFKLELSDGEQLVRRLSAKAR
ncbi:MAG: hypothetical protein GY703_20020 [Gammaproteobacteria bacterium]|nr:hypothetical protein [Gammaproteobacteria bacterium]